MGKENLASADDCKSLFELMNRVRDLAPWEWMEETDLFGVQHPDTGEIGFVSIMGMAGEHYAVSAYQGAGGLYGFWHMQDMGPYMQLEDIMTTPQLQASYEDRNMLDKHDYHLIKSLGLKYRGRSAWPQFRSFRRGYAPWYIEKEEAKFLQYILEQVLIVAPRVKENSDILDPKGDHHYLVRVAKQTGDMLEWEDKILPIDKPSSIELSIEINPDLIETVKNLPQGKFKVEADLFMLPTMIGERTERPYFPYMLMMLDTTHDMVIGFEMLSPIPSIEEMWASIGATALQQLVKIGSVPKDIRVRNDLLFAMLQPFAKELKLNIKQVHQLPKLDLARMEMERFMR